jgi:iron(III) transport system substrate-binding protein
MNVYPIQWKRVTTGIVLTSMLTVLAACGGNNGAENGNKSESGAAPSPTAAPTTETVATVEPAVEDAGKLVVYLNDFDAIIADMFKEATGYDVELVTGNGAEIMSRIEAEKGNPHWDIVWADMMPSIHGLGLQGQLLEGWEPENLSQVAEDFKAYIPENKTYFPTGAHASGIIVYNKNFYTEETAPKTWADFAKAEYKDQIATADPAIAAPAYPFVAALFDKAGGVEEGKAFFDSWFNNGLRVYPKNPQIVQALSGGEVKLAALQESNAYSMVNNNEPIGIIWPEEGAPASVRVAAIQKNTKNPNAAKAFIEFLLDAKTQQQLVDEGEEAYFDPAAQGVTARPDRAANAKLIAADAAWASQHEAEIKQWFADKAVK